MASLAEKTVTSTEFKAKCLDLMAQVHDGSLRRLRVTKHGKPLVAIERDGPVADAEPWSFEAAIGCMTDFPRPVPDDHDWEKPVYSDQELDGFLQAKEDLIEAALRGSTS